MDFFARQEAARRTTQVLRVIFPICVLVVTAAITCLTYVVCGGANPHTSDVAAVPATLAALITLTIVFGASLYKTLELRAGGSAVARSMGGVRVERTTDDPRLQRLLNVVQEMAIAAAVPTPEVYVLESEDGINTLVAGNTAADAAIIVTRGLVTLLSRDELQAVIGHEFSHIVNGDMRLNSRLLGWVYGLLIVAVAMRMFLGQFTRIVQRAENFGLFLMIILIVFIVFAFLVMGIGYIGVFFARILQAAVSRQRERLADASALQFTRNPEGLRGALLKIAGTDRGSRLRTAHAEEAAHMLFAAGSFRLFGTHPPLLQRLCSIGPRISNQEMAAQAVAAIERFEKESAREAEAERSPRPHPAPGIFFDRASAAIGAGAALAAPASMPAPPPSANPAQDSIARVLALLRSAQPDVAGRQDAILARSFDAKFVEQVSAQVRLVSGLAPALRLPAVQREIASLRNLTTRRQRELRALVHQLAMADGRIDVFECCLALLLESLLRDLIEGGEPHGSGSLLKSADAVHRLLAIVAGRGHPDDAGARAAYAAGVAAVLPHDVREYAALEDWPNVLSDSLRELDQLRASAKRPLVEALRACAAQDGRLTFDEADLLRTVCAVLHCPLPPMSGQSAGIAAIDAIA